MKEIFKKSMKNKKMIQKTVKTSSYQSTDTKKNPWVVI